MTNNSSGLFAKPPVSQTAAAKKLESLEEIKEKLPDAYDFIQQGLIAIDSSSMSNEEKIKVANNYLRFNLDNAKNIQELMESPGALNQIEELMFSPVEQTSNVDESTSNKGFQLSHVLFETVKVLGLGALSTVYPITALLLAAGLPSAAQAFNASEVIINSGIAKGAADLCAGLTPYCDQGYLTDATLNVISEFARSYSLHRSCSKSCHNVKPDDSLLNCLSTNNIGMALARFLETTSAINASSTCYTDPDTYSHFKSQIVGTNITAPNCLAFKQAMNPIISSCTYRPPTPPTTQDLGMVIIACSMVGGILGVMAIATIAFVAARTNCCTKSLSQ